MLTQRSQDPYVVALRWLARRELSVNQVRQRLSERGFKHGKIDEAIDQLLSEKALDDHRTALAYARTAIFVKYRGRSRVIKEIESLGISQETVLEAVNETLRDVDETDLLERALLRRLSGSIKDNTHLRRLYHYLLRQGFEPAMAMTRLIENSKITTKESKK